MNQLEQTGASTESLTACYEALARMVPPELVTLQLATTSTQTEVLPQTVSQLKRLKSMIEEDPHTPVFSIV